MKKLLLVALLATSLVNANNTLIGKEGKNIGEKFSEESEMTCCTRTGTATISDGQGNSTTVVRTVTGCSASVESMDALCSLVQRDANMQAIAALSQSID